MKREREETLPRSVRSRAFPLGKLDLELSSIIQSPPFLRLPRRGLDHRPEPRGERERRSAGGIDHRQGLSWLAARSTLAAGSTHRLIIPILCLWSSFSSTGLVPSKMERSSVACRFSKLLWGRLSVDSRIQVIDCRIRWRSVRPTGV